MAEATLEAPGGAFAVPAAETVVGHALAACGDFSPGEGALYRRLVPPGGVVVDGGAHVGWFTRIFAEALGPRGRVHAFEPQPALLALLERNLAGFPQALAHGAALGAAEGRGTVPAVRYDRPGTYGGLGLVQDGPGVAVPVTCVDALDLPRCDLIKADVQGMERELLIGAADTIGRFRPLLYLENEDRERSPVLLSTLFALGYRVFWHLPRVIEADAPPHLAAVISLNLLCVPEEAALPVEGLVEIRDRADWWQP